MDPKYIRNFAIIAHIDHGKSTLSDRLLELTGSLTSREMQAQVLDAMDLERERGITIKAHSVRMMYQAHDGHTYQLNLIDTPGHVDFSYEVSRSLASCEGALLVVDASQGVEAQTLANAYLAISNGLEIIPIINKIDLPSADIERTKEMIENTVGLPADDAVCVSAKTGLNVASILEAVVHLIPPPAGIADAPLQALIFDSWFDPYKGVIVLARVINGTLRTGQRIRLMSNNRTFDVESMGVLTPKPVEIATLSAGEVGFFVATIKDVADTKVGDTITDPGNPAAEPLPGFEDIKSMVFAGLYTIESHEHGALREALGKLKLNDASFSFEPEASTALGFGFRCGFLGLLHMEIIQERLEREFNLDLITTAPGVRYNITLTGGEQSKSKTPPAGPTPPPSTASRNPSSPPKSSPTRSTSAASSNSSKTNAANRKTSNTSPAPASSSPTSSPSTRSSSTSTTASNPCRAGMQVLDYALSGMWTSPMVKMDILVSGDPVDALSIIVHRDFAYDRGKALVHKMRELIPRQMFEVAIQAAIGSKIVARETVSAIRKDVIAKCYGGDISRKKKLLNKQKEGKKRMKRIGQVDIPQEAFLAVLKVGE